MVQRRVSNPRTYSAWPACARLSPITLTMRTPSVTGGSHDRSTIRSKSEPVDRREVGDGLAVDRVVVADQPIRRRAHGVDLGARVAVAGRAAIERKGELVAPALGRPALLNTGGVGNVVVLDPGQVPDEPRDRVGLAVRPPAEQVGVEALDRAVHRLPHAGERVNEEIRRLHRLSP